MLTRINANLCAICESHLKSQNRSVTNCFFGKPLNDADSFEDLGVMIIKDWALASLVG